MAILTLQLHRPRFTLVEEDNALVGKIWFEGVFTGDELSVEDGQGSEYPTSATVTFTATHETDVTGSLTYSAKWRDDDEGVTYPGSCQLSLTSGPELCALLQSSGKSDDELHLMVETISDTDAIFYMGPYDEGEYHWKPTIRNPLPARIKSIGLVPVVHDPSKVVPQVVEFNQTQATLDALLEQSKSANSVHIAALQALTAEAMRTRVTLLVIAVLCAAYVVARAI